MRRRVLFFVSISLIGFSLCSSSWAGIDKRMELRLKDGRVSADLQNATLGEVAAEIGRSWGIRVETYGQVDTSRLISTKFENTSPVDSLHRLLRGVNFLYIPDERLCLLGSGEHSSQNGSGADVVSVSSPQNFPTAGQSLASGEMKKPEAVEQPQAQGVSAAAERIRKEVITSSTPSVIRKTELSTGETTQTAASQTSGDVNQSSNSSNANSTSNNASAPFTAPIVFESNGQAVSGLSSDITYDPNLLTNPKVTLGEVAKQAGKDVIYNESSPGHLKVGVIGLNNNSIPDGTVAQITFDVVRAGQISWSNQPTASDPQGNTVTVTFKDGKITPVKK